MPYFLISVSSDLKKNVDLSEVLWHSINSFQRSVFLPLLHAEAPLTPSFCQRPARWQPPTAGLTFIDGPPCFKRRETKAKPNAPNGCCKQGSLSGVACVAWQRDSTYVAYKCLGFQWVARLPNATVTRNVNKITLRGGVTLISSCGTTIPALLSHNLH